MVKKPAPAAICSCFSHSNQPSTSGQSEGGDFTCHLLSPHHRASSVGAEVPTPTETHRDPQRCAEGRTVLPRHTAGTGGQGASTVTGGDSEGSGSTGVSTQEGVATELRQHRGALLVLPPQATLWSIPPEPAPPTRKALFAPGDNIKDPKPSAHQAAFRTSVCAFVKCNPVVPNVRHSA